MKKFSLKALGASLIAFGLVLAGAAVPAQAATMTAASATSTSSIGTSGTNETAITITATTVSAAVDFNDLFYVDLPTGWTFTSTFMGPTCNANTATQTGINLVFCSASNTGTPRLKLANGTPSPVGIPAGTVITVTFQPGFLNVAPARDFNIGTSGFNNPTAADDTATVTLASSGGGGGSTPSASLSLAATQGQLVAGSSVAIVASGLEPTAAYTVVVRSTPQTIGTGNAFNGAVNTSVTLPAGLGAGWHSLTFSSTASDGSPLTSVLYFEVSASGTLLATSSTEPAVLANTGFDGVPYLAGGLALAVVGGSLMLIARRKATH